MSQDFISPYGPLQHLAPHAVQSISLKVREKLLVLEMQYVTILTQEKSVSNPTWFKNDFYYLQHKMLLGLLQQQKNIPAAKFSNISTCPIVCNVFATSKRNRMIILEIILYLLKIIYTYLKFISMANKNMNYEII